VRDLNRTYAHWPALHALDCEAPGFEWIDCDDRDHSILAYLRRGPGTDDISIVVCNFTPVVRGDYLLGVPEPGVYRVVLNSDAEIYGGGNIGNSGTVKTQERPCHGRPHALELTLPPLAAIVLTLQR